MENKTEFWLRGPLEGIPILLNPIAACFLQVQAELREMLKDFPEEKLWVNPLGIASVGFHLNHLKGVMNRLFTYARGESLSVEQLSFLTLEENPTGERIELEQLLHDFDEEVKKSMDQLKNENIDTLSLERKVGRKGLPSTVMGLYIHSAEHSMRHLGQILVTVKMVKN